MPSDRYFIDAPLAKGATITLEDHEHHHLVHVMRAKVGDTVELVNGKGFLAKGTLKILSRRTADFQIESVLYEEPSIYSLILAQAVPRMNRLDLVIEKGTELGMTALWLFPTERSERQKLSDHQLERLRSLSIAAMKQCGRLYLPEISVKPSLSSCIFETEKVAALFGDLSSYAPSLIKCWPAVEHKKELIFFVGPESGFSPKEEEAMKKMGIQGIALHKNILRTETAAIAALTLLQHLRTYY